MSIPLEVQELHGRGRGVVATQDIATRTVVLCVSPDIAVLYSDYAPTHCAQCFLAVDKDNFYGCPQCDQFVLCHRCLPLQQANPSGASTLALHQTYCCPWYNALPPNSTAKGEDTDYVRFIFQYAARRAWEETHQEAPSVKNLLELDSNEGAQSKENVEFCKAFAKKIVTTFHQPKGEGVMLPMTIDEEELSTLLLITKNNSLGFPCSVVDGELHSILGWSLQCGVCRLNHSCEPNAEIIFPEPQLSETTSHCKITALTNGAFCLDTQSPSTAGCMAVRTLQPVEKGEELCISYVNMNDPAFATDVRARSRQLLEQYRFLCQCPLCIRQRAAVKKTVK